MPELQRPEPPPPAIEPASAPVLRSATPPTAVPTVVKVPPPNNDRDRPVASRPKKPRAWQAMFKRRPTALAAAAEPSTRPPGAITSQAEFRREFLKVHKDRVLRDNAGNCFRLLPIVMNGDCGFGAIAKGINVARDRVRAMPPQMPAPQAKETERRRWRRVWLRAMRGANRESERGVGKSLQAKDIRKAMLEEIKKARKTYLADGDEFAGVFTSEDFDKLEREVSLPGISGHWLGTVLGVLEHVIVAQAMNVSIFLYQFDLGRQCIRQFESATVNNPDCEVFLFFTGPAACGHFDTLVKISDPRNHLFVA